MRRNLLLLILISLSPWAFAANYGPTAGDYPTLQAAVDANPGKLVFVPPGEYPLDKALEIRTSDSGLYGPGRIVQNNPEEAILHVQNAERVQIRDVTLTRAAGKEATRAKGLLAEYAHELVVDNVQILNNQGGTALRVTWTHGAQVRHCLIRDYVGISVDDRLTNPMAGFAFKCLDGTGIQIDDSSGTLVQGNRVIETKLLGTRENQKKHDLGRIIKTNGQPPNQYNKVALEKGAVTNWHQGSGILFSSSRVSDSNQLCDNYVENAGQGFDIHCDHVVIANNIVNNAFMGMKAMHGSRNVVITGNQFRKIDLWGIMIQPGSLSGYGVDATTTQSAQAPNVDAGIIIANNIISDFGYGNEYWVWNDPADTNNIGIIIYAAQVPTVPALNDVIVTGNMIYNTGRDGVIENGRLVTHPPRYKYAIYINDKDETRPKNVRVANNIFHPGSLGVSNVKLKEYAFPEE